VGNSRKIQPNIRKEDKLMQNYRGVLWQMVVLVALCALIGVLAVGADKDLPRPRVVTDRQFVVGYVTPELTSESVQRGWKQAQIEAEHRGWELVDASGYSSVPLAHDAIATLVNKNVDAIVFGFVGEQGAHADLVLAAREAGIGVYGLDIGSQPNVLINVTQLNGVCGARMAYYGIDRLKGTGNVAIMNFELHPPTRRRGFVAEALFTKDFQGITLLDYQDLPYPGWEDAAFNFAANWCTKYGNDLNWIFAPWDTAGIFAARAIEQAGYTKDDIFVTGIDGGKEAYAMIRQGTPFVATMSQPFELYAHDVFEVIQQVQVEGILPGEEGSIVPSSGNIYESAVLTDDTNLPPEGASIHEVFNFYGGDPNDPDAWYNWGEPSTL